MTSVRGRASARVVGVVLVAFVAQTTSGCLSNEYTIKKDELVRLASLPPEARGARVVVSQDLGERRADEVDTSGVDLRGSPDVWIQFHGGGGSGSSTSGGGWRSSSPGGGTSPGGTWRGSPPSGGGSSAPSGGWHGSPSSGGGSSAPSGGWHGSPSSGGGGSAPTWHGSPSSGGGSSSGGGGGISLPSGGNGGDALAAVVVAIIIGAAIATVVLAASEGMRFAGDAEMSPEQTLYVRSASGQEHAVALGALTPEEAALASEAVVMDDEGYGLRRLAHGRIDRTGGTFRFELGGGAFNLGRARATGLASHVQVGVYPRPTFGFVLDLGLDGGDVDPSCCVGPIVGPTSLRRDSISLHAEVMPIGWGPLRLGAFAGGGVAIAGPNGDREQGAVGGGGARLELELTAHMALSMRAGASTAYLPSGWSTAGSITGGIAIY